MDNWLIIPSHLLFAAFLFLLANMSESSSPLFQENDFPYITSDLNEISGKSYDYIVVGGGTAGCPLAATLSERYSVLLVERGSSPHGNPLISDKMYYGFSFLQTDEFSSVAQSFVSKEGVASYRGRVLGGSSAINGGFYSRASDDFIRKVGWDEEAVKEAYEWVESRIVFKPEVTMWQSVLEFGLLEAGFTPYNGFSWEHVEGTKIGGTMFDEFGIRRTSADLLAAGNPANITVLLTATVKNIILHKDTAEGNDTIAGGIRFMKSNGSTDQIYEAYLNHQHNKSSLGDIILSAGALGSPQILMLSGIGPKKHLKNFSIPVVLDLKGVGREMQDNPAISMLADTEAEYRLPDTPQVAGIAKDFKFIVEGGVLPISFNATRMPIAIKLAFPESKGKLELNNTDPRHNPSVQFNYLTKEKDLDQCVEMAQLLQRVSRSNSVLMFLRTEPQNNLISSPQELRSFCKQNVRTYYHYHGGCTVGSVVDNEYKVYGTKSLRIIDGSTFSESPGTNPMATLLMLGRYQGIKILRGTQNTDVINNQD